MLRKGAKARSVQVRTASPAAQPCQLPAHNALCAKALRSCAPLTGAAVTLPMMLRPIAEASLAAQPCQLAAQDALRWHQAYQGVIVQNCPCLLSLATQRVCCEHALILM